MAAKNAKTLPPAECGTDHKMLSIMLKLKMVKMKRELNPVCHDMNNINNEFTVQAKNRFLLLLQGISEKESEEIADSEKTILIEVAKEHISKREEKKTPWISQQSLDKIEERRHLKGK